MGIRAQQFYSRLDFRDETRVLAVLAALQGCHFMVTISGLSVAHQLLVTLSPSLRPALEVVLEVDTYDDSRGSPR